MIRPELTADPDVVARFEREARAIAGVRHPGVAELYDAGRDAKLGMHFVALELVPGRELGRLVRESGPLPVARAIDLTLQILSAIDAAHAAGVIHRDLTPSNVLVETKGGAGRARIVDFGLSKLGEATLTATGVVLGTPAYMSPEQARGEPVDARTDLYSVGVLLYEMLVGGEHHVYVLIVREASVGSGDEDAIPLDVPGVRPGHARVVLRDGRFAIEATRKDAPVVLPGRGRLAAGLVDLEPGQEVILGTARLRFSGVEDEDMKP